MSRLIGVVSFIVLGCFISTNLVGEEKVASEKMMKMKLDYSKNILDGLLTEDFQTISKNAKALNKLGKQKWQETESPRYRTQYQVFWFTSGALVMAAEQKDTDAAALSYTQMTLSCINCHKLLRSQ